MNNKNRLELSLFVNTCIIVLSLTIVILMTARIFGQEIESYIVIAIQGSLAFLYLIQMIIEWEFKAVNSIFITFWTALAIAEAFYIN